MFNNVVMLTGKENFLVHWAVNQLKKKYGGKEFQAQNVHEFDGAQAISTRSSAWPGPHPCSPATGC